MYIVDKFSPSHLTLAISIRPFVINIYYMFRYIFMGEEVYWNRIVFFVIFLIVIIGSMIHNEIFIINKWGLNKKTKLFLNKEFNEENLDVQTINPSEEIIENDEKSENDFKTEIN